jgi:hypothetical protein
VSAKPELSDIVRVMVAGFPRPFTISADPLQDGTYSLELVNGGGPSDAYGDTNLTQLGRALGPHFVLAPNGRLDDDPSVPEGNGAGVLVPIGPGVVVSYKRKLPNKS